VKILVFIGRGIGSLSRRIPTTFLEPSSHVSRESFIAVVKQSFELQ